MPHPHKLAAADRGAPARVVAAPRDEILEAQRRWFLRMTSHELRTPLNSIIGFAEILAGQGAPAPASPQGREYAGHILASGRKLLRLVDQVLEIVRLEGRAVTLEPRREALDHVIDDVRHALAGEIAERRARLSVEGEGALPAVLADRSALRTVIVNLVHNAITFSPAGGEVRLRAVARGGAVEIEIEDDGPGLAAADIPRLLAPFEQGENAITRAAGGAGLGLAIVKLLTGAMGGRLRLVTEPGWGLKAVVLLPVG
jgi:signal transduction histidine kinase